MKIKLYKINNEWGYAVTDSDGSILDTCSGFKSQSEAKRYAQNKYAIFHND